MFRNRKVTKIVNFLLSNKGNKKAIHEIAKKTRKTEVRFKKISKESAISICGQEDTNHRVI